MGQWNIITNETNQLRVSQLFYGNSQKVLPTTHLNLVTSFNRRCLCFQFYAIYRSLRSILFDTQFNLKGKRIMETTVFYRLHYEVCYDYSSW